MDLDDPILDSDLLLEHNDYVFHVRPTVMGRFDYTNKTHLKVYEQATQPAYEKFSVENTELHGYVQAYIIHSKQCDWVNPTKSGILHIPRLIEPDVPTLFKAKLGRTTENLLEKFGVISLRRVRIYVETYLHKATRAAQDDHTLFVSLHKSLSKEGLAKVLVQREKYTIDDCESGVMFLKVILDSSSLTSNATIMKHKRELTELVALIKQYNWNIPHFNNRVKKIELSLHQHGSSASDLVHQVFQAYLTCPDKTFKAYIEAKQCTFEDGTETITAVHLMNCAQHRYLILQDRGTWKIEEEQIDALALSARFERLEKKLERANKRKRSDDTPKDPKSSKRKTRDDGWKYEAPKKGEVATKLRGRKTFYWCSEATGAPTGRGCDMWTVHKPADYKGMAKKRRGTDTKPGHTSANTARNLRVATTEIENFSLSNSEIDTDDSE